MIDNLFNSPALYTIAITLIHFIWQGALVAGVLKLLLLATPYTKPQLRYLFASIAMTACLLLPVLTYAWIYSPDYLHANATQDPSQLLSPLVEQVGAQQSDWYQNVFEALPFISIGWAIIVFLLALKLCIELVSVNRMHLSGSYLPTDKLQARFEQLIIDMGVQQKPQLLISLKTNVPMAIGWLKPIVLVPASMVSGLSPQQLDMLLLHELAHIRRHDYLVNFVQTLVEITLFFHPAVRWISKQMRNEREYCSDDLAVAHAGSPVAYAKTLAKTATLCKQHRHSIPSMAMAASGGDLKQRVMRLVDHEHHCSQQDDSGKWLATMLIIFTLASVALKPYLTTPFLDTGAGHFTLFQSATENQAANSVNSDGDFTIPQNSLANKLLQQNNSEEPIMEKVVDVEIPIVENTATAEKKVETSTPVANQIIEQTKPNSDIVLHNGAEERLVKKQPINKPLNARVEKAAPSKIETTLQDKKPMTTTQAMEELEANIDLLVNQNPYAKQISALGNQPAFLEQKFAPLANEATPENESFKIKSEPMTLEDVSNRYNNTAAKLLTSYEPKYPSSAKRKGLELDVLVSFTIDRNGRVKNIEFERKNKVNYFRSSIKDAVEKWRFQPALENGERVESHMSKIFSFSLMK